MLKLAAEKGIKTWKQVIPMKDVGKGVQGVKDNSVRYRYAFPSSLSLLVILLTLHFVVFVPLLRSYVLKQDINA